MITLKFYSKKFEKIGILLFHIPRK